MFEDSHHAIRASLNAFIRNQRAAQNSSHRKEKILNMKACKVSSDSGAHPPTKSQAKISKYDFLKEFLLYQRIPSRTTMEIRFRGDQEFFEFISSPVNDFEQES